MKIEVKKMSAEEAKKLGITSWPTWEKGESSFPWHYDSEESCYILEGEVEVEAGGSKVKFAKGDFVVFPKDLSCQWHVIKKVRKHYKFG